PTQPAGQAFLNALRENGFIEGKNVIIERRFAEARLDRYDDLLAELIRLQVDLIVTSAENATLANGQTPKFPLLCSESPIQSGKVLSRAWRVPEATSRV